MTNIIIQPEVIKTLADCVVDVIQNKIDWQSIDWQAVAEKSLKDPKNEWIPVSERLPEKNGWFITTCEDICERAVHTVFYDAKYKKWGRGGVVAWQPMPEPYKEADND